MIIRPLSGASGTPAKFAGYVHCPPAGRVGAYRIRPPGATIGGEYMSPGMIIHPLRDVWGAYAIRPYTGYVHSGSFGYPAKFAGPRRGPPKHLNGAQPQQLNTYRTTTFSVSCPTLMM